MRNLKLIVFLAVLIFLAKVFIADQIGNSNHENNRTGSRIPASTYTDHP